MIVGICRFILLTVVNVLSLLHKFDTALLHKFDTAYAFNQELCS